MSRLLLFSAYCECLVRRYVGQALNVHRDFFTVMIKVLRLQLEFYFMLD